MEFFTSILEFFREQEAIIYGAGLLILVLVLLKIFEQSWLFYRQALYKASIEWALLEIIVPREVMRTPRAMEQFFLNLHGLRNAPGDLLEKYIDGEVTQWWSLEMISYGGEIHFYIRTPKRHQKMVAAGIYAQYPNAEVIEVIDYAADIPERTSGYYEQGLNMFGSEILLRKEDYYPITIYEVFEKDKTELSIDPISALLEVLANIRKEERVYIQILIRPRGADWNEEADRKSVV